MRKLENGPKKVNNTVRISCDIVRIILNFSPPLRSFILECLVSNSRKWLKLIMISNHYQLTKFYNS